MTPSHPFSLNVLFFICSLSLRLPGQLSLRQSKQGDRERRGKKQGFTVIGRENMNHSTSNRNNRCLAAVATKERAASVCFEFNHLHTFHVREKTHLFSLVTPVLTVPLAPFERGMSCAVSVLSFSRMTIREYAAIEMALLDHWSLASLSLSLSLPFLWVQMSLTLHITGQVIREGIMRHILHSSSLVTAPKIK